MSRNAINDPRRSIDDAQWSDYLACHRERRAHPRPVTLSGEQVQQIAAICHQAREILFCADLLLQFPEQWNENLRSIRSTASTIRYFAKPSRQRYLPQVNGVVAAPVPEAADD